MIYKGLDLHGINDIVEIDSCDIFSRYPQEINNKIGHNIGYQFTSAEIRFVPLGKVSITIASKFSFIQPKCMIYYGDFASPEEFIIHRERTFLIEPLKKFDIPVKEHTNRLDNESDFSLDVVRIVLHGEGFYIKDISGEYRLPKPSEIPSKKILSYGTSITQGIGATSPDMSYPWILGRNLHMDSYNYALSGKCLCEDEVVTFIAQSNQYDIITIEASVNMISLGYHEDEYYKRLERMLQILRQYQKDSLIVCIDILPYWADYGFVNPQQESISTSYKYKEKLRLIIEELKDSNIILIDAHNCISIRNLSSDLIHPTNHGMVELGYNISKEINKYYKK